jgi:hypothetical protein
MEGALLGYCEFTALDPERIPGRQILCMLACSASIGAGKVIFNLLPRVQSLNLSLNTQSVGVFNGGGNGGGTTQILWSAWRCKPPQDSIGDQVNCHSNPAHPCTSIQIPGKCTAGTQGCINSQFVCGPIGW